MAKKKSSGLTARQILIVIGIVAIALVLLVPPLRDQLIEGTNEVVVYIISIAVPILALVAVFSFLLRRR